MTTSSGAPRSSSPAIVPFLAGSPRSRPAIPRPRVLVADDNGQMCLLLAVYLQEAGYEVVRCHDGFELVEHLGSCLLPDSRESYDLIISDIRMPHLSGLEILERCSRGCRVVSTRALRLHTLTTSTDCRKRCTPNRPIGQRILQ